jgi:hypothetical protein
MLVLAACARQPEATLPAAWARADGQPVVSGLLDIAALDCKDELESAEGAARAKADKVVDDFISCMRAQGYVQVKS